MGKDEESVITAKSLRVLLTGKPGFPWDAIAATLRRSFSATVMSADSLAEVAQLVAEHRFDLSLAAICRTEPASTDLARLSIGANIPLVAVTECNVDEDHDPHDYLRENIVDYFKHSDVALTENLIWLVRRLQKNAETTILVVDDSPSRRAYFQEVLSRRFFRVIVATQGREAVQALKDEEHVDLMLVDYEMPGMNGVELVQRIRRHFGKKELPILATSAHNNSALNVRFLKAGASDSISLPCSEEELYCRIEQNLEMVETMQALQDLSHRDYLTRLYNRRYFFEAGELLLANSKRTSKPISVLMMDIDHFKRINDTLGHATGDEVLKAVAKVLKKSHRKTDLLARLGGEEFALILSDCDQHHALEFAENIRASIEKIVVDSDGERVRCSVSIGATSKREGDLDAILARADALLYMAKENGRNQVVGDDAAHLSQPSAIGLAA